MKPVTKRQLTKITMLASLLSAAGWSANSYACAVEPYITSVCVMAVVGSQYAAGFEGIYLPANGQAVSVNSYQALYALVGSTYGGNSSQINLPDLRGRVVIGAGTYYGTEGTINYNIAQKGGTAYNALAVANLPPHTHALGSYVSANAGLGTMSVNVGLGSLGATTSLSGVTASAAGSGLTLNGSSGGTTTNAPSGGSLATTLATTKIYSSAAPTIGMQAGSISGTAPVTFNGTPTTTLSGSPIAALLGAPSVSISGQTDLTGGNQAFSIMQPYLALRYYIAVQGIYPTPN